MDMVLLTALGVGGATVIGAIIGFAFKKLSHTFSDIVLSFAAGVMLAAAVLGLILPSIEYGGRWGLLITVAGIFAGALCLNLIDRLVPHLHKLAGVEAESHHNAGLSKVLLFVTAIAIHNLPEGIAAGVGFGSGDTTQALIIAGGIALQNIPEGMVIIGPHRIFCGDGLDGGTPVCAGICGRYHAVRHQRRDDPRDPRTRTSERGYIRPSRGLLRHAGD